MTNCWLVRTLQVTREAVFYELTKHNKYAFGKLEILPEHKTLLIEVMTYELSEIAKRTSANAAERIPWN